MNVIWSPDRTKVITEFSNSQGRSYQYFDYQTRAHSDLPSSVVSVAFSPDGQSLIMAQASGSETNVVISGTNGRINAQTVLKTRLKNISVSWPRTETMFFTTIDETSLTSLYALDEAGNLTKTLESLPDLRLTWSSDGLKVIYSSSDSTFLSLLDTVRGQSQTLPIETTADLCQWSQDGLVITCAINERGETKVAQLSLGDSSPKIIASNIVISPEKIFLSADRQFLIILSREDRHLYAIRLD